MKITVYLPDQIGQAAKKADLNLSALLRSAVTEEIWRVDAMENLKTGMQEYRLDCENDHGWYTAKFVGKQLDDERSVFITDDEKLLYYDESKWRLHDISDEDDEDLVNYFGTEDEYVQALNAIGRRPVVEI